MFWKIFSPLSLGFLFLLLTFCRFIILSYIMLLATALSFLYRYMHLYALVYIMPSITSYRVVLVSTLLLHMYLLLLAISFFAVFFRPRFRFISCLIPFFTSFPFSYVQHLESRNNTSESVANLANWRCFNTAGRVGYLSSRPKCWCFQSTILRLGKDWLSLICRIEPSFSKLVYIVHGFEKSHRLLLARRWRRLAQLASVNWHFESKCRLYIQSEPSVIRSE